MSRSCKFQISRPTSCVLLLQQAVEDLQCEEEKVNLLTKEKAKLQVHVEEVITALLRDLMLHYNHTNTVFITSSVLLEQQTTLHAKVQIKTSLREHVNINHQLHSTA